MFRSHGESAVPISWSSSAETFLELDRATALRYVAANGPTGEVQLWFKKRQTRFVSYAADRYAEAG